MTSCRMTQYDEMQVEVIFDVFVKLLTLYPHGCARLTSFDLYENVSGTRKQVIPFSGVIRIQFPKAIFAL
jgi:hypothetical protein